MPRHRRILLIAGGALVALGLTVGAQQYQQAPQLPAPVPGLGGEHFAANLGIYFQLVPYSPYGGGYNPSAPPGYGGDYQQAPVQAPIASSYGARLTRYPVPNSPAAYLQLEPGDMIVSLDNLPIQTPNDVRGHRYQTSMVFVNIRTSLPQSANIYIP